MLRKHHSSLSPDEAVPAVLPAKSIPSSTKSQRSDKTSVCMLFIGLIFLVIALIIYLLLTRLNLGVKFPVQSEFEESEALLSESTLEIVAELPIPPGNIAATSTGRIFFNFHPEYNPIIKIAELTSKTEFVAYPSVDFQERILTCLSLRVDTHDNLWLLDYAFHGIKGSPKLVAIDTKSSDNKVIKEYTFPSHVAGFGSMLNDFQIDLTGEFIYIADTSIIGATPALIVYSVKKDVSYRILNGHKSMFGTSTLMDISGHTKVNFGPLGLKINVDSIALDRTGSRLYYGALTDNTMFTIGTSMLLASIDKLLDSTGDTPAMWDNVLSDYVRETTNMKPVTDGMSADGSGNIYMTAVEHSAIAVALKHNQHNNKNNKNNGAFNIIKLIQSESLLRWPDGMSFGPDGLYITNSALHLKFTNANISQHAPYHILRIPVDALRSVVSAEGGEDMIWPASGQ